MIEVAALYKFAPIADPPGEVARLSSQCAPLGIKGTLLIAPEGVNGTVAGPGPALAAALAALHQIPGFEDLTVKMSTAAEMPFRRLKIRAKREIVTMGVPGVDPAKRTGTRIAPQDWDAVVDDPQIAVIDTRNAYEVAIGRFEGAIDPGTGSFRDFPAWWAANRDRIGNRRIAMYCTGGIRCEKASAFLLEAGVPEVLQLDGGILKYLETVPGGESRWQGECFVFDGRVALRHGLEEGQHTLCHACGRAVSPEDKLSPDWREGVSCPSCIGEYTDADRARFAERQRQSRLARARGAVHLTGS